MAASTQIRHRDREATTAQPPDMRACDKEEERQCMDGTCVARIDLCPEEEMMSQDTILIMIGVGMAVVLFLIVLYCLQQRRSTLDNPQPVDTLDDLENPELLIPPPPYEEALNVTLYPPTPQMQRTTRMSSAEEPVTPPPNYDAALHILAQSYESVLTASGKNSVASPLLRRSLSSEHVANNQRLRTHVPQGGLGAQPEMVLQDRVIHN